MRRLDARRCLLDGLTEGSGDVFAWNYKIGAYEWLINTVNKRPTFGH